MKKIHFIFLSLVLLDLTSKAQQKVPINEVKKINVLDYQWSPIGMNRQTVFELVNDTGVWHCYQIKQLYYSSNVADKNEQAYQKENSTQRKFIKSIPKTDIDLLLKTIKSIKQFKHRIYNITPGLMRNKLDSVFLKNRGKKLTAQQYKLFVSEMTKRGNIENAIEFLQFKDVWTDDYPTCAIEIVKKNNDTIKIVTRTQMDYMLPWTIDKSPSFDLNINQFFLSVTGEYPYSNKSRLKGENMPRKVFDYIQRVFVEPALLKQKWIEDNPSAHKLITSNFSVIFEEGNDLLLKIRKLPFNFGIAAHLNPDDTLGIKNIIKLKNAIVTIYSKGNFVFNYYQNKKDTDIIFRFHDQTPANHPFVYSHGMDIYERWLNLKENQVYDRNNILQFEIKTDDHMMETWLVLPDNKLVLVGYFRPRVAGKFDTRLDINPGGLKECMVIFNSQGDLLTVYYQMPNFFHK